MTLMFKDMFALLLVLLFAVGHGKEVVVLTDATFLEKTQTGVWFIEFYAR